MYKKISAFFDSQTNKRVAITIGIAVVVGGALLLPSLASGFFVAFETESGTLAGSAQIINDTTASGGKAIQFAATTPNTPPPAPSGTYLSDTFKKWSNGPNPTGDPNFYPIGVWEQSPERTEGGIKNGTNYQNIGINIDWNMPDWPGCAWCGDRMDALVSTNWFGSVSPTSKDIANGPYEGITEVKGSAAEGKVVKSWAIGDEADMNKVNGSGVAEDYPSNFEAIGNKVRAADSTRPIYANFGKSMAMSNPGWIGYHYWDYGGSGSYTTDMAHYCNSADVVSADYYGWTDPYEPADYHGAWTYGRVIDSIRYYCGPDKIAMGLIETGHPYSNAENAPNSTITPDQMEAAVWNVVVHGGNGYIYFVHHFNSNGLIAEDSLLLDSTMKARVASVNAAVKSLAPVLNSPSQSGVSVVSTNSIPVTCMYKQYNNSKYIVAQADGDSAHTNSGSTAATFAISGVTSGSAIVVGENRTVPIVGGKIVDNFDAYAHHVYQF